MYCIVERFWDAKNFVIRPPELIFKFRGIQHVAVYGLVPNGKLARLQIADYVIYHM